MKFCPQCGTSFEPETRFCAECGFDRLTVESQNTPVEIPLPPPIKQAPIKQARCPQCGNALLPGERFCPKCRVDTLKIKTLVQEAPSPTPSPIIPEVVVPSEPVKVEAAKQEQNKFCPKCAAVMTEQERFCPQCGFDTKPDRKEANARFQSVTQPEPIQKTGYTLPLVEKVVPPIPKPQASIPPPAPQAARVVPSTNKPPEKVAEAAGEHKNIRPWLWIPLVLIGIGVIGTAGWFGYEKYINEPELITSDTIENTLAPQNPDTASITIEKKQTPTLTETVPAQPVTGTKPLSHIDQELAKQKAKKQNNPVAKTNTSTAMPAKPDLGVKVSPSTAPIDKKYEIIMEVGRKEDPKSKNPKNPTKLSIHNPTMIVRITTDHYNGGMGTSGAGTISIKDEEGNLIGSYKAVGKSGKDGTPDSKWVALPHIVLEKGTYYIWDSDKSTWSKNFLGVGFVVVEGYKAE